MMKTKVMILLWFLLVILLTTATIVGAETITITPVGSRAVQGDLPEPSSTLGISSMPSSTSFSCTVLQKCSEIDEAWQRFAEDAGSTYFNQVWDIRTGEWASFETVYPPEREEEESSGSSETGSTGSSTGSSRAESNEYDDYIREAAAHFGVEAALIKALMKYESSFNPRADSGTGCRGLMQVCSWGTNFNAVTNTYQNLNLVNDPFDPRTNIFIGTSILASKERSVPECGSDKVKAVISSYNLGQGIVNAAISANSNGCNFWVEVHQQMLNNYRWDDSTNQGTLFGYTRGWLTQARIEAHSASPSSYVSKVYAAYLLYRNNLDQGNSASGSSSGSSSGSGSSSTAVPISNLPICAIGQEHFRFVVASDIHCDEDICPSGAVSAIPQINSLNPSIVIINGDMISAPAQAPHGDYSPQFNYFKTNFLERITVPKLFTQGNHDMTNTNYQTFLSSVRSNENNAGNYYYKEIDGNHFILLDGSGLSLEESQMTWFQNTLNAVSPESTTESGKLFIFAHVPLYALSTANYHITESLRENSLIKTTLNEFKTNHPNFKIYWFSSHQHVYYEGTRTDNPNIYFVFTGSLEHGRTLNRQNQPTSFILVDICNNNVDVRAVSGPNFNSFMDENFMSSVNAEGYTAATS